MVQRKKIGRRGAILIWIASSLFLLLGTVVLAIDVGYSYSVKAELQATADASALAGVTGLLQSEEEAHLRAIQYASKNTANGRPVPLFWNDIEVGIWDGPTSTFLPDDGTSGQKPDAVRVQPKFSRVRGSSVGLFFARVLGTYSTDIGASATAFLQARDIVLVIDLSASMNYDSTVLRMAALGRANVEANMLQMWQELGNPSYGNMQWTPVHLAGLDNAGVKAALGITSVPYPYASGNWDEYINFVRSSPVFAAFGMQEHYGYFTLLNYWLLVKPRSVDSPNLWQASAQPVTAVKDSIRAFLRFVGNVDTNDQVGLVVFNSPQQSAVLESGLTSDFMAIGDITAQRQAGHYDFSTNIAAGLREARLELQRNGRPGAFPMVVLLADGIPNRPTSVAVAKQAVLAEAQLAQQQGIRVFTISLGALADQVLMAEIATITQGAHFNIPGGQSVAQYEGELETFFQLVADHRPLMLVE